MVIPGASNDMTATPNASDWQLASVQAIRDESPQAKTFILELPRAVQHLPGQHYELRLTADDGYQAARLYSAASAANGSNQLELTIAAVADGEITPYLHEQLAVGDRLEVRGPLGKFFVWDPDAPQPALLLGGGSGVVPLRAMVQAHQQAASETPMRLLYGARDYEAILYKDEFLGSDAVTISLSNNWPDDWRGHTGYIDRALIAATLKTLPDNTMCYVCGLTRFVESIADTLVELGIPPARIKAERFGA
jgi:ferredoxin-NADP reductase